MLNDRKSKSRFNSVFRRILLVVLGLLLGISVYFTNAERFTRGELPMPFGVGAAVVLSGSMEPALQVGDLIIVKKTETYEEDDIVVYQSYRELIVHRIKHKDGDTYITKGDANPSEDSPITIESIQGVVVARIPFIGNIFNILHTPVGIIIILILSVFLIESSFSKKKEEDNEERDAIIKEIDRLKNQTNEIKEEKE